MMIALLLEPLAEDESFLNFFIPTHCLIPLSRVNIYKDSLASATGTYSDAVKSFSHNWITRFPLIELLASYTSNVSFH